MRKFRAPASGKTWLWSALARFSSGSLSNGKQSERVKQKNNWFLAVYKKLFNITACKCKSEKCKYEHSCQVPTKEQAFLNNKHSECKLIIYIICKIEIKRKMRRNKRILLFNEMSSLVTLKTFFWLYYQTNENIHESWMLLEFWKPEKRKKASL